MGLKNKCVGYICKIFPTFVFLIITSLGLQASNSYVVPDFAFPKTVEAKSDSLMQEALKAGNSPLALRYGMNIVLAKNELTDSESLVGNVALTDSMAIQLSQPFSNLAYLLEAEILKDEYLAHKSIYDARKLPLDEKFPQDPNEWSGEMFKTSIYELIEKATEDIANLKPHDISEISLLISNWEQAKNIGMTDTEFIVLKSVAILNSISTGNTVTVIPFYPEKQTQTTEGLCREKSKELLDVLESRMAKGNSLVKSLGMIEYASLLPDYDQESYLKASANKLSGTEGEGVMVYELWRRYGRDNYEYYKDIKRCLENYPKGFGAARLKNALAEITKETIQVDYAKCALVDSYIKGNVTVSNLNKCYLLIYKLGRDEYDDYDGLILKKFKYTAKPVDIIEINEENTIPFTSQKTIELPGLKAGVYAVIPSKGKKLQKDFWKNGGNGSYSTIRVSDISVITSYNSNEKSSGKVYVVKGANQEPVAGAIVSYYSGANKTAKGKLVTNEEGWVRIAENGYFRIEAIYKGNVARGEAGFGFYPESEATTYHVSLLTDLAVYRPGDTIRYAVVGWRQEKSSNSLIKNARVAVTLRDANYSQVGCDTLEFNEDGRAWGDFIVPKGRLLGRYQLVADLPDYIYSGGGSVFIQVEEYKLPSFHVGLSQMSSGKDGEISFEGIAQTFSGMPVADSEATVKVEYHPWRWWSHNSNASYSLTTQTNPEGRFEFFLPVENLKGTIFERGRFTVTAEVTSSGGDTQKSNPLNFYLGKAFEVRPSISDKIEITTDSISFNVPVYDIAGLPTNAMVEYSIENKNDSSIVLSGEFESPLLKLPASRLPSGEYSLKFKVDEDENCVTTQTILWSGDDSKAPYPTVLWVPQTEYQYAENQSTVDVKFRSYWDDWLLMIVSDGNKILSSEWLAPQDTLWNKKIEIPDESATVFVTLSGMHRLKAESSQIKIVSQKSQEKLDIETISFRDRLTAGDKEDWTFKFKIGNHAATGINAFAVMTDKALNSIYDFQWGLGIWQRAVYNRVSLTNRINFITGSYRNFTNYKPLSTISLNNIVPGWETYGYPLVAYGGRYGGPVLYRAMATKSVMKNERMDTAAGAMIEETSMEMAMDDSVSMESPQAEMSDSHEEELRPVEMPVAFFMPGLKANEEGEVTLKFTVPNFNTTWQLQLAGYNEELQTATKLMDAVASKPVMVNTNLPLYLRTGDKAQISATLYNNTGSTILLGGRIEILNPTTGEILTSKEVESDTVYATGNRVMSIGFDVPDNLTVVAVRAYALGENHSDGEQGFIPVLPSSTPVVEAKTFYAGSNQEKIELKLPKFKKDSDVTLKYCDNPLWEVLLSLPGITEGCNSSALSISRWLYGTLLASDIIRSNEEINNGLKNILSSQDTTLTMSNLAKEANLKIVSIEATPWLNNSANETMRIRSLEKYFDQGMVDASVDSKVKALRQLQQADGGWSWFDGMKSSPYITSGVLEALAYLNSKGLLNAELQQMARKGVAYYDSRMVEMRKKNKQLSVAAAVDYFYARDMLELPLSGEIKKIKGETLDSISSQWRRWSLAQKAKGAMVLLSDKKYDKVSNEIEASLKQFLGKRLDLTEEALLLELFRKKEGNEDAIDLVMQNMFLQKETQDWGGEKATAAVVHSLAGLTPSTNFNRSIPEIFIDGKKIDLSASQALTGNFTINVGSKEYSGKKIEIRREVGIPAWGGIISQYVAPIQEVKKEKVENLSIEKRVFKEDSDGDLKEVSSFNKGDKIVVVLNLSVGKDMDYVAVYDSRSACLQPDDKISGMIFKDGIGMYREIRAAKTSFFIERMKAGKYVLSYECHVDRDGEYSLGIAETQCLYSPSQVAHSAGSIIKVE